MTIFALCKPSAAISLIIALTACGGGGSSSGGGTGSTTLNLSGKVQAADSDISSKAAGKPYGKSDLTGATVDLYKMYPDGEEELVATTTTDSNGDYSFAGVAPASGGNGASTDFYYEVRASSGNLDLRAPAAPLSDTTVNVSPESNLAAKIVSDVVDVPTSSTEPTPDEEVIEAIRVMVEQNANELGDSISIPSASQSNANTEMANGIAAAGGNAEKMYKAVQFGSEAVWLMDDENDATAEQAGAYIKRVIRESCNQPSVNPVAMQAAEILGQEMIDGSTYTPTQVVTAYNAIAAADAVLSTAVTAFRDTLEAINDNFAANADEATAINTDQQLLLFVKRGLKKSDFSSTTSLDPDQALVFLMFLAGTGNNLCNFPNVNITEVLAELTGSSTLSAAHFADIQIYHDSGFSCDQNSGFGHFRAEIDVYSSGGVLVNSVSVASTDSTALGGDGTESLTLDGVSKKWKSQTDGVCVDLGTSVTYTVTAQLSVGGPLVTTVARNHPLVPEADTTVGGNDTSNDLNSPDKFTVKRPLYEWESPALKLASITDAPAGSKVKYTYEFSHVDVTDSPTGPLNQCGMVNSGALYEVDNFLPTVDCDPVACATATGKTATNILCRMNIQTFLVDEADRFLGQAAGHFPVFCVDADNNGTCGDE